MTLPGAECCQPILMPFPSGVAWAHGRDCRTYPKRKIAPDAPWHDGPPVLEDHAPVCEEGNYACTPTVQKDARGTAIGLFHAEACPVHPGERVALRTYAKGRRW